MSKYSTVCYDSIKTSQKCTAFLTLEKNCDTYISSLNQFSTVNCKQKTVNNEAICITVSQIKRNTEDAFVLRNVVDRIYSDFIALAPDMAACFGYFHIILDCKGNNSNSLYMSSATRRRVDFAKKVLVPKQFVPLLNKEPYFDCFFYAIDCVTIGL